MADIQDKVHFSLSRGDRDFLLEQMGGRSQDVELRLRFGVTQGDTLAFSFTMEQMLAFLDLLADLFEKARRPAVQRRIDDITLSIQESLSQDMHPFFSERLMGIENDSDGFADDDDWGETPEEFEEMMDALNPVFTVELGSHMPKMLELMAAETSKTGAANNDFAPEMSPAAEAYMHQPRPQYQGLSLNDLGILLNTDWMTAEGPFRFAVLDAAELECSPFFQQWLAFLQGVDAAAGGVALNKDGTVNRKGLSPSLAALDHHPRLTAWVAAMVLGQGPPPALLDLYAVLGVDAGMLRRHKGRLVIIKKQRMFLEDPTLRSGLYYALFSGFFGAEKTGELLSRPEVLEDDFAYVLCQIHRLPDAWTPARALMKKMMLPGAALLLEDGSDGQTDRNEVERLYATFVLDALILLGLLEHQQGAKGGAYRKSPLFKRFVVLDLAAVGRPFTM